MNTDIVCSIYNFNAEREFVSDHSCQLAGSAFLGSHLGGFAKGTISYSELEIADHKTTCLGFRKLLPACLLPQEVSLRTLGRSLRLLEKLL